MDCIVHGVAKSRTPLSNFCFHLLYFINTVQVLLQARIQGKLCLSSLVPPPGWGERAYAQKGFFLPGSISSLGFLDTQGTSSLQCSEFPKTVLSLSLCLLSC